MTVYRITSSKYGDDISGYGASIKGGRWNPRGVRALYTSMHVSLACLEIAVHLIPQIEPPSFDLLQLHIPDDSVKMYTKDDLPNDWDTPDGINECITVGEKWLDNNEYLALKVPSSIVNIEYNFVLNPQHARYAEVKVIDLQQFHIDNRLLK